MGMIIKMMVKYSREAICPMRMNGSSTGWLPIHVRISRSVVRHQNVICVIGRNVIVRCFDRWRIGRSSRIRIDMNSARTPPSLLGIDRRMA